MRFPSWRCTRKRRAQSCALPQASMPMSRGAVGNTEHQVTPGQALAHDALASLRQPDTVKDALCDGDSPDAQRVLHRTRLLWLKDCTRLALMRAYCNRSAQGWIRFNTTSNGAAGL